MQSIAYHHGFAVYITAHLIFVGTIQVKKEAESKAFNQAKDSAFCYAIMLIVCKVKEKASNWGKKEYDEKRIGKILFFESYTIPQRIGLRGVQPEQI